jgi:hypothetical protein
MFMHIVMVLSAASLGVGLATLNLFQLGCFLNDSHGNTCTHYVGYDSPRIILKNEAI